jgi:hypothetical protein
MFLFPPLLSGAFTPQKSSNRVSVSVAGPDNTGKTLTMAQDCELAVFDWGSYADHHHCYSLVLANSLDIETTVSSPQFLHFNTTSALSIPRLNPQFLKKASPMLPEL